MSVLLGHSIGPTGVMRIALRLRAGRMDGTGAAGRCDYVREPPTEEGGDDPVSFGQYGQSVPFDAVCR